MGESNIGGGEETSAAAIVAWVWGVARGGGGVLYNYCMYTVYGSYLKRVLYTVDLQSLHTDSCIHYLAWSHCPNLWLPAVCTVLC